MTAHLHRLLLCFALAVVGGLLVQPGAQGEQTFFKQHCLGCHGPDLQEAKLRLDQLSPPGQDSHANERWALIAEMIESGDMPPADEARPKAADVERVVAWISGGLAQASRPAPAVRRMNRIEYEHTVQDLLGVDEPLAEYLSEDGQVQGFDNVAGGLGISSILMERYLEAADAAFEATIRRVKPLPPETRRQVLMEQKDNIASVKGKKGGVIESHGAFVDFTPGWPPARTDGANPIDDGIYRCRIAVWPHDPGQDRTLGVAVYTGPMFGAGKRRFHGIFDATGTPEKPRIIEFTTFLRAGESVQPLCRVYPEHVTWRDQDEPRPGVAIAWVETHGPLNQDFPSESQVRLFGESPTISMAEGDPLWKRHRRGVHRHEVVSSEPRADVERILREFAPRAFRRPVDDRLVDPFVDLALRRLEQGASFEQAVRVGVTAILCSPHFLLLNQPPPEGKEVDDYTIASRMSYFLWSSLPDEELLKLAEAGKLRDPAVRRAEVARMLRDPKVERFVDNFTGQWLDLRELEFTTPDDKLYPEYDDLLLWSMEAETKGFFRHVLAENLSVLNFVDSDFAVLNQRMATHYGVPGVRGHEQFRMVPLPEDSIRGGVLTQASVLKVTANGTSTSPVLRGVWVLDKLLGQPAPPPPPGVPAVEPDIRGATTIREQLAKHRENSSCARCHARIDPPGFALEEFDVIGGWREKYRSLQGKGRPIPKTRYYHGPPVESDGELVDGRAFSGFAEFRQRLLEDREVVARAIAEKLLVYGCGRPVTSRDRAAVQAVVESARAEDFGLRSMIQGVVASDLFTAP